MDDYVTFEIAKKLKDKGFDYPCVGHYVNNNLFICHYINAFHSDKNESIDCPTILQALKWLRKEKTISIEPCATPYNCWYYMIKYQGEIKATYTGNKYRTYEQAALAGIEYVLNNLI